MSSPQYGAAHRARRKQAIAGLVPGTPCPVSGPPMYPTPSAAVAVGLPAAFGRLHLDHSVPVAMGGANGAHPDCCTRRSATGARPSQDDTEQPDLHDASGQARNTCEGA